MYLGKSSSLPVEDDTEILFIREKATDQYVESIKYVRERIRCPEESKAGDKLLRKADRCALKSIKLGTYCLANQKEIRLGTAKTGIYRKQTFMIVAMKIISLKGCRE